MSDAKVRKPIHVVKKDLSADTTIAQLRHDEGMEMARAKADDLAIHFPNTVDLWVTTEQDDNEIRFYVDVSITF